MRGVVTGGLHGGWTGSRLNTNISEPSASELNRGVGSSNNMRGVVTGDLHGVMPKYKHQSAISEY